jgi:hypothetical protein
MIRSTLTVARLGENLSFDEWKEVGVKIAKYASASSWWLGDWLAYGQAHHARRYRDAVAETGFEYQTLRNYAAVARRFAPARRRDDLSFQHHAEVCPLSDEDQDFWLDLSAECHWTRTELRRRLQTTRRGAVNVQRPLAVSLLIYPKRECRWREAARSNEIDLKTWIVQSLDEVASATLGHPPAESPRTSTRTRRNGRAAVSPTSGVSLGAAAVAPSATGPQQPRGAPSQSRRRDRSTKRSLPARGTGPTPV